MFNKKIGVWPALLQKLTAKSLLKSYPNYQPVFLNGRLVKGGDRYCLDRWTLIKREIIKDQVASVLDLGCAEGYYVLQSAKVCGCFSLGVDADVRRLSTAQLQLVQEEIKPAGFMLAEIDLATLDKLPHFDAIVFLSVMHHMMYSQGADYCREILRKIKTKINKFMIFEMGQSNETKNAWASKLPDMGERPHEWIKDFLLSAGFNQVTKIGESDSYQKDQNRAIFKVE